MKQIIQLKLCKAVFSKQNCFFIMLNFLLLSAVLIFAGNLQNVTPVNNEDRLYYFFELNKTNYLYDR